MNKANKIDARYSVAQAMEKLGLNFGIVSGYLVLTAVD